MHPLSSEDDDNNMCARDRNVINAYVLRELNREACIASITSLSALFPELLQCFLFQGKYIYDSVHQCVHMGACMHVTLSTACYFPKIIHA